MPKTILAVDYDQKTLEEIRSLLDGPDVTFLTAHDGTQAVDIFRSSTPDLVLTSALLPKLNGFELCKKITTGELGEIRPVVMFSGIYKADKYRKEAILGCGALDFLEKPLVQAHLVRVARNLLCQPHSAKPELSLGVPIHQPDVLLDDKEPISMSSLVEDQNLHISDDPLEVDELFETGPANTVLEIDSVEELPETPLPDSLAPDTRSTLLPPDSKEEIEAALASILIDSNREVQMRDQRIAEEIELEIASISQNILELEQILGGPSRETAGHDPGENEIIDLEDRESLKPPKPVPEPECSERSDLSSEILEESIELESPTPSFPIFTLSSKPSKNWIRFAIIAAVLLGTAIILLLGR